MNLWEALRETLNVSVSMCLNVHCQSIVLKLRLQSYKSMAKLPLFFKILLKCFIESF